MIDNDLKEKSQTYLEIFAPKYFNSLKQMSKYFESEEHKAQMKPGYVIVVNGCENYYMWSSKGEPVPFTGWFDDGDLFKGMSNDDRVEYKFAFYVDEREVCSTVWEGVYPKYIRRSIDLSNNKGKLSKERIYTVGFDEYLNAKIVEGKSDLVWQLIKDICDTCGKPTDWYTTNDRYGKKSYENYFNAERFWEPEEEKQKRKEREKSSKKNN